jgi:hypothetical protein
VLDVHPEPEHARILVRIGEQTHEVGHLDDTAYIQDIHAGRAVMASLIRERLFTLDRDIVFEHIVHATDVESWLTYRAERPTRSILDPRIVERIRERLSAAAGEILVVERGYAGRLRRRGGVSEGG